MIPAFMATMYASGGQSGVWMLVSLVIFVVASLTDFVDGYIARHYNQTTDFGKFLDPLADKLLVIAAMAMFCQWGVFPAWALMIVLTREFAVTGLRLVAVQKGTVIAAGWSGKAMAMFCQWGVFPAWALMIVLTREFAVTGLRLVAVQKGTVIAAGWSGKVKTASTMVGLCFMMALPGVALLNWIVIAVIVVTTLYSGVEYFVQNWNCLWESAGKS